jgi:esterase/lipase superfamily enzyme
MRRSTYLAAVALTLFAETVWAGDTVLAVDVSEGMAAACPPNWSSLMDRAVSSTQQRLEDLSPDEGRVGLVTFASEARIVISPTVDHAAVREALDRLASVSQSASLLAGLTTAGRVLEGRESEEGGRILVLTSESAGPEGPVRALLATLHERGVSIEVELLGDERRPNDSGWRDVGIQLLRTPCSAAPSPADPVAETGASVRRFVANELGVPVDSIGSTTDLVSDLGTDRATAFELLARICDEHDVSVPASGDLTNLGAITDYIAHAGRDGIRSRGPSSAYVQTVFYGTNRMPRAKSDPRRFYSGARSRGGQIRYGVCEVSIPLRAHKPGSLEAPFLGLEYLADERQHILLKKVTPMDRANFFRNLSDKLHPNEGNEDLRRDALVFVPGFNTSFEEVARRTAQTSYDLGFTGAPIMFSWPSDGSFLSYLSDREDIEWSVPHIDRFLTELLEEARPRRLHLIAHSMGNEGLLRALTLIALRRGADAPPIFDNVILAAPDFDAQIFVEQTAPRVRGLSKRWTVYVSDKDGALNVSSRIRSAKRLGLPISLAAGVDTVDATGIEVTPWSVPEFHSYYATKRLVIADLIGVLSGLDPSSRELSALMRGGLQYWSIGRLSP